MKITQNNTVIERTSTYQKAKETVQLARKVVKNNLLLQHRREAGIGEACHCTDQSHEKLL